MAKSKAFLFGLLIYQNNHKSTGFLGYPKKQKFVGLLDIGSQVFDFLDEKLTLF